MRTFKEKLELGARTMQASRGRVVVAKTDGNEPEIVEDIDLQEANPRSPSSEDMHGDVDTICHQVENEPNPEKVGQHQKYSSCSPLRLVTSESKPQWIVLIIQFSV